MSNNDEVDCIEMQPFKTPLTDEQSVQIPTTTSSWSSSKGDNWCLCGILVKEDGGNLKVPVEEMKQGEKNFYF